MPSSVPKSCQTRDRWHLPSKAARATVQREALLAAATVSLAWIPAWAARERPSVNARVCTDRTRPRASRSAQWSPPGNSLALLASEAAMAMTLGDAPELGGAGLDQGPAGVVFVAGRHPTSDSVNAGRVSRSRGGRRQRATADASTPTVARPELGRVRAETRTPETTA